MLRPGCRTNPDNVAALGAPASLTRDHCGIESLHWLRDTSPVDSTGKDLASACQRVAPAITPPRSECLPIMFMNVIAPLF
jgi:hypothetical protein